MVLLKNDGTLPLKQGKLKIALVGPLADQTKYLLGNYSGSPTHIVSILDGMKAEFPEAQINFVAGDAVSANRGRTGARVCVDHARKGSRGSPPSFLRGSIQARAPVLATRTTGVIDLKSEDIPQEAADTYPLSVEWDGFLSVNESGEYSIGVRGTRQFR